MTEHKYKKLIGAIYQDDTKNVLQISDDADGLSNEAIEIIKDIIFDFPEFTILLAQKNIDLVEINTTKEYKLFKVITPDFLISIKTNF